jgi:hypothetical protein
VVAAFFAKEKTKAREKKRQEVESLFSACFKPEWVKLKSIANTLGVGEHPLSPFHWEIEFPEVFSKHNPGFDAVVGNPPFAGKNTIAAGTRVGFGHWLQTLNEGAHGNADLVAYFFRRAFSLVREGAGFGFVATNTIGQGDTRATGLMKILTSGGAIVRATRRLRWPGE